MDPSFTRIIKLDILCALALEPTSINAVLEELRTYIRHDDSVFVCASVRAVGKIVEMARIVYDRQGVKIQDTVRLREDANVIALNCLYGLLTLAESSDYVDVVGECVDTMQRIISLLLENTLNMKVNDPNDVVSMVMRKIVLLLIRSLTADRDDEGEEKVQDENDIGKDALALKTQNLLLPTEKVSTALWIVGEWLTSTADASTALAVSDTKKMEKKVIQVELLRLLARLFPDMGSKLKLHSLHLASKVWLSSDSSNDLILCEYILGMGRVDIIPDVRDRARYESQLLHLAKGLKSDVENLPKLPQGSSRVTTADAKSMLLKFKPSSSWLPIEKNDESDIKNPFRFGSLSSMFSHKAGDAYIALTSWASEDSPKHLRDPPQTKIERSIFSNKSPSSKDKTGRSSGFYESSSESSSSSDDSSSSSSSSSSGDSSDDGSSSSSSSDDQSSDSSDESSEEDDSTDSSGDDNVNNVMANGRRKIIPDMMSTNNQSLIPTNDSSSDSDSDSDDDSSSSSQADINERPNNHGNYSLIDMGANIRSEKGAKSSTSGQALKSKKNDKVVSAVTTGLEGLVMAPLVVEKGDNIEGGTGTSDIESESSNWSVLVRNELSGGLSITGRHLRGATRKHEAKLLGLDSKNSTVVVVQLKFENRCVYKNDFKGIFLVNIYILSSASNVRRNDGKVLRRIRLMQKKIQNSNIVATTRVLLPQEISLLPPAKVSYAMVGIEFANASDKDGAMMARFDAKCDRSTSAFDVQSPLSELLLKSIYSRADFDERIKTMGGVHQSAKSSFLLTASSGESVANKYNKLPAKICKFVNIVSHLVILFEKQICLRFLMLHCEISLHSRALWTGLNSVVDSVGICHLAVWMSW